jgi:hypothetical protein
MSVNAQEHGGARGQSQGEFIGDGQEDQVEGGGGEGHLENNTLSRNSDDSGLAEEEDESLAIKANCNARHDLGEEELVAGHGADAAADHPSSNSAVLDPDTWINQCLFECRACEFQAQHTDIMMAHCTQEHGDKAALEYEMIDKAFLDCPACKSSRVLWTRKEVGDHVEREHNVSLEAFAKSYAVNILSQLSRQDDQNISEAAEEAAFVPPLVTRLTCEPDLSLGTEPKTEAVDDSFDSVARLDAYFEDPEGVDDPDFAPAVEKSPKAAAKRPKKVDATRSDYGALSKIVAGGPTKWFDQTLFRCLLCDYEVYSIATIKAHCRKMHADADAQVPVNEVFYHCILCSEKIRCQRIAIECHMRRQPHKMQGIRQYSDMYTIKQHEAAVTREGEDVTSVPQRSEVVVKVVSEAVKEEETGTKVTPTKIASPKKISLIRGTPEKTSQKKISLFGTEAETSPNTISLRRAGSEDSSSETVSLKRAVAEDSSPKTISLKRPKTASIKSAEELESAGESDCSPVKVSPTRKPSEDDSRPSPNIIAWADKCHFRCRDCLMTVGKRSQIQHHLAKSQSCEQQAYDISTKVYHNCRVCDNKILHEGGCIRSHLSKVHGLKLRQYEDRFLKDSLEDEPAIEEKSSSPAVVAPKIISLMQRKEGSTVKETEGASPKTIPLKRPATASKKAASDEEFSDEDASYLDQDSDGRGGDEEEKNGKKSPTKVAESSPESGSEWFNRAGRPERHKCRMCGVTVTNSKKQLTDHFRGGHGLLLVDYTTYFMNHENTLLPMCPICEAREGPFTKSDYFYSF